MAFWNDHFSVLNHLLLFKAMIVIYNYFKSNLILADTSSLSIHRETPGPEAWGATSSRGTSKHMHWQGARAKQRKGKKRLQDVMDILWMMMNDMTCATKLHNVNTLSSKIVLTLLHIMMMRMEYAVPVSSPSSWYWHCWPIRWVIMKCMCNITTLFSKFVMALLHR